MSRLSRIFRRNPIPAVLVCTLTTVSLFVSISKFSEHGPSVKPPEDTALAVAGRVALEKQESLNANLLQLQKEFARVETELKYEKLRGQMLNKELEESKKKEFARVETELKYEKLRGQMLNKELEDAKKMLHKELEDAKKVRVWVGFGGFVGLTPPPPTTQQPKTPAEFFHREQERRLANILDVCSDTTRPFGVVNSLLPTEDGMTYCVIPRLTKDRLPEPRKFYGRGSKMLRSRRYRNPSEIFFAVQDPFKRLWETYVDNFRLPRKWNTNGIKIEAKRPPKKSAISEGKQLMKTCGMDVTFQEFVLFALKSYENEYDPFYRLCDPCQLKPTYVIRDESRQTDSRFVLQHFNLAWVLASSNFTRDEHLSYINNTEARKLKCATGGELGKRLWYALEVMGIIPGGTTSAPYIDDNTLPAQIIKIATDLFQVAEDRGMDRIAHKRKYLAEAFGSLPQHILDSVKKKYEMDFRLFGYERDPSDFEKSS
ncbi:hypothetical protein EGW08_021229 [Elysia chlorotica]|uniref:Carbohydrate sulfotransferase n=1 Tax=Elysia chlorotica TaxID=188477 RepID=A0A3S1H2P1_ELYCH|nr:hypothetical protein EGW08_021229 [Elysia chlorotica]